MLSCGLWENNNEISQRLHFNPTGLDPARNTELYEYQIFSQIYEPLLHLNNNFQSLIPCLADTWSVSDDNINYVFVLKSGVFFHDGTKLTAEDAKISFMRQIKLRPEYPLFSIIDTIRDTDSLTLHITLKHPYLPFLYSLASPNGLMVISKKALMQYGDDIDKNLMFKRGELDVLHMVAGHWLDRLKWLGKIEYYVQKPLNTLYLGFNLKNKPVNNITIRKAILMGIDIKKSVLITNRGNALPAKGPLPPIYKGFEDIKQAGYNQDAAKKLLTDAGYPNGLSLNLVCFLPAFSRQTKIELLKSQMEKIGIHLNTIFINDLFYYNKFLMNKDCHLFLAGYGSELIGDPGNFLYSLFHSNSPNNHTQYKNKDIDNLLMQAFQEVNTSRRHQIYRSIVKKVLKDIPAVYDSHIKSHYAYNSKKIKTMVVNPYEFIYFHRLETYE
jgi:peptide/nickel transport system substrate-binding protein